MDSREIINNLAKYYWKLNEKTLTKHDNNTVKEYKEIWVKEKNNEVLNYVMTLSCAIYNYDEGDNIDDVVSMRMRIISSEGKDTRDDSDILFPKPEVLKLFYLRCELLKEKGEDAYFMDDDFKWNLLVNSDDENE